MLVNLTGHVLLVNHYNSVSYLHITWAVLRPLVGFEQTESGHSAQTVSKLWVTCQIIQS